jgi:hypothetical protein
MVSSGLLRRVALVTEDTILHSHRRENLKSYLLLIVSSYEKYG